MDRSPACSICELLPREVSCNRADSMPVGFSKLLPTAPAEHSGERLCPECGAVYDLLYSETWESGEIFPDVEILLSRKVQAPAQGDLDHPVAYRRQDAAYFLARQPDTDLEGLLTHHDAEIRTHVLVGLGSLTVLPSPLAIRRLLNDPVDAVRAHTVRLCMRQMREASEEDSWDWLLSAWDTFPVDVRTQLLSALLHSEVADREAFGPLIERALRDSNKELRKRGVGGLEWLALGGYQKESGIQRLVAIMLDDPEWDVRQWALSGLSSLVSQWGGETSVVLQALSKALLDPGIRYIMVQMMHGVIRHHDISVCLPSLVQIVVNDKAGYSDDASTLILKALEKGLHRPQLVTELIPGLGLATEQDRRPVSCLYRHMLKRGWDLRPAYEAIFRRLTSTKPSHVDCDLAADLTGPLLASNLPEDRERLTLILFTDRNVSGAVTRALAALARKGQDLSPVLSALTELLAGDPWVAEGARMALDQHLWCRGRLPVSDPGGAS